jgi:signal peptidase I
VALNYVGEGGGPHFYWEQLSGGPRYVIAEISNDTPLDNTEEFIVPPGNVFLLGDNRDNSRDSRMDGFVPIELLRAKPLHVFWSEDWGRIGERLE